MIEEVYEELKEALLLDEDRALAGTVRIGREHGERLVHDQQLCWDVADSADSLAACVLVLKVREDCGIREFCCGDNRALVDTAGLLIAVDIATFPQAFSGGRTNKAALDLRDAFGREVDTASHVLKVYDDLNVRLI